MTAYTCTRQIPNTIKIVANPCSSVADPDPGYGIVCFFGPWIRDPGWVESQHPDPGSGMNNPDHIFYCLETIFFVFLGVKILKFFYEDPGSGMEKSRIRDPG
jgi:hypothetical protein